MSETIQIDAVKRDVIGKANRRLGSKGKVPAVVYGAGREAEPVALVRHDIELQLQHGAGHAAVYRLAIEGEKPVDVVIRAIQRDPRKGTLAHIDFLAVSANKAIHVAVPLEFVGDAAGVKAGGMLSMDAHELQIEAKPGDLPESIAVDISALEVGSALYVADIAAPAGVTILDDAEKVVCSVIAPHVAVEEEAPAEEITEPEVIGEKSSEEE